MDYIKCQITYQSAIVLHLNKFPSTFLHNVYSVQACDDSMHIHSVGTVKCIQYTLGESHSYRMSAAYIDFRIQNVTYYSTVRVMRSCLPDTVV